MHFFFGYIKLKPLKLTAMHISMCSDILQYWLIFMSQKNSYMKV